MWCNRCCFRLGRGRDGTHLRLASVWPCTHKLSTNYNLTTKTTYDDRKIVGGGSSSKVLEILLFNGSSSGLQIVHRTLGFLPLHYIDPTSIMRNFWLMCGYSASAAKNYVPINDLAFCLCHHLLQCTRWILDFDYHTIISFWAGSWPPKAHVLVLIELHCNKSNVPSWNI